jgi:hypothetical protein
MSEIRKEVLDCIDNLPDSRLEALRPILKLLVHDTVAVDTDLTDEEREIIRQGREEYKAGGFVSLDSIL